MKTEIIKIDPENIDPDIISKATAFIDAGKLVIFPTETVYGIACKVEKNSLAKLNTLKNRPADKFYTLHLGDKSQITNYVPTITIRAQKLIKNALPGPLTMIFDLNQQDIDLQKTRLSHDVFENLYKNNSIGLRCPDNKIASALLNAAKNSIVAPSANTAGRPPAVNAEEAFEYFEGQIDLILDGGPCRCKKSSTVARVTKTSIDIIREGAYSREQLEHFCQVGILFVCTGNTCRSPMAEGFFKKYLAEKIGCKLDQLEKIGYSIVSAGTMGVGGIAVTPESLRACAAEGVDLKGKVSTALTKWLLDFSDIIYVMSDNHRKRVLDLAPDVADKCFMLDENKSVPDPIGQDQQVYNRCAEHIKKAVKKRLDGLII